MLAGRVTYTFCIWQLNRHEVQTSTERESLPCVPLAFRTRRDAEEIVVCHHSVKEHTRMHTHQRTYSRNCACHTNRRPLRPASLDDEETRWSLERRERDEAPQLRNTADSRVPARTRNRVFGTLPIGCDGIMSNRTVLMPQIFFQAFQFFMHKCEPQAVQKLVFLRQGRLHGTRPHILLPGARSPKTSHPYFF